MQGCVWSHSYVEHHSGCCLENGPSVCRVAVAPWYPGLGWVTVASAGLDTWVECGCVWGGGRARSLAALGEQPASSTTASDPSRLTARACPSLTCQSDPWPLQSQNQHCLIFRNACPICRKCKCLIWFRASPSASVSDVGVTQGHVAGLEGSGACPAAFPLPPPLFRSLLVSLWSPLAPRPCGPHRWSMAGGSCPSEALLRFS